MTQEPAHETTRLQPLRLWPGVLAVAAQWLIRFGLPAVTPGSMGLAALGGVLGGLAVVLWWAFLSRAPRSERWGGVALMLGALTLTYLLNHESMGQLWLISYAAPTVCAAFVSWAVLSRRSVGRARLLTMSLTILLACGAWTLFRSHGITGYGRADFAWRWAATPEERLLAQADDGSLHPRSASAAVDSGIGWPGFRGSQRDGIVHGAQIETDWSQTPPVELWRRPVGPGWSSFSVGAGLIYTQEQRGADEVVSSHDATTGEPIWKHYVAARFWESQAGAGPRATPTLYEGRLYALGATGILSALDAETGSILWTCNVGEDAGEAVPIWGFSGSPLTLGELVVVAASGTLVAYDAATGELRWRGPDGDGESYASPHRVTLDGVEQILLPRADGLIAVDPDDGEALWEHAWPGFRIVQPAVLPGGDLLLASEKNGVRRLRVGFGLGGWTVEELWTSTRLKPYFSDFVVHEGHVFGFDGGILACIDLENGERRWKGGRYGHGQLLLLPELDMLLVLSEHGGLALVKATPDGFVETAAMPVIEGKTWNHPVLADGLLFVRNGEEMAAFRLRQAGG